MDNKIIYSIIIYLVIIVIAIILYFLFVKKQTTISSILPPISPSTQTITIYNNCSSPVRITVYYPSGGVNYVLQPNQSVSAVYEQNMTVMFTSIPGVYLGTVIPSPGQVVTPPQCPYRAISFTPLMQISSSIPQCPLIRNNR